MTRPRAGDFFLSDSNTTNRTCNTFTEALKKPHSDDTSDSLLTPDENSLQDYDLYEDDITWMMPNLTYSEQDESDSEDEDDVASESTAKSTQSLESASDQNSNVSNTLPKSFLQLKGISVGNFNMNCNFRVETAISIMAKYNLSILAIQEHTPWNRELYENEVLSIQKHCDKYGYFVTISKLQIVITDKQLLACHRETTVYEDGRAIKCRYEISEGQFVTFVPVYGVPHSSKTFDQSNDATKAEDCENNKLQTMLRVKNQVHSILAKAIESSDFIYVFGDLQDTPDNSKLFHSGSCRIPKHPLGIVQTCENLGLTCSIFEHLETLKRPIISRHGFKGGRFIDGMYTTRASMANILGISIIEDVGIFSDHDLIISKIDLGIEQFQMNKEKEERLDFRSIMNIPVRQNLDANHPTLDDKVFKGVEYELQAQLYARLQEIANKKGSPILQRITDLEREFIDFQNDVIDRTKATITPEEQTNGKLITRTQEDAHRLNTLSGNFFGILHDICREANLSRQVPIVQSSSLKHKRELAASEKALPGISSFAITRSLDQAAKRCRRIIQRSLMLVRAIRKCCRAMNVSKASTERNKAKKCARRLLNQKTAFMEDVNTLHKTCQDIATDRRNHIIAIETARGRRIFDKYCEYQTVVIELTGKEEFEEYTHQVKQDIFGVENVKTLEQVRLEKQPKSTRLMTELDNWSSHISTLEHNLTSDIQKSNILQWGKVAHLIRRDSKRIAKTLKKISQEEFNNSKTHHIRTGKYGNLAKIIHPKPRSGPIAGSFYPTKTGDPVRRARNDTERQEACTETHRIWMDNPPGETNCHFLDLQHDEVGPHGVSIDPLKDFDDDAQLKYLENLIAEKSASNDEILDRVRFAHKKLPELFKKVTTDSKITYPFKYDSSSGKYLFNDLESNLRKDICKGNGKARATGFAIPVLGRLPKIFTDVYLIKCQIQMALRLLDLGTECSLRICIGKPCGGVRPLTVGHDDNVYLNGFTQQALQKEIARLQVLPDNICSYQRGKGCSDATIVDGVVKEVLLQNDAYYMAELADDAEKMFDRLYMELQAVLLLLAGAGMQGFTEWQCANMHQRTNRLVTDIFTALLKYICGLPQGSGFSVEIANLYAMLLLLWWNMDPVNHQGSIVPFTSPRHGFPLLAGGVIKPVASLAYVDDVTRYVAMLKATTTLPEFFKVVQGYCDLIADLSLVIKMGRNVKKCTILLYNIPEDAQIPEFSSIAWSYDARGPIKGIIDTVVVRRDPAGSLIIYDVPHELRNDMPEATQRVIAQRKYLGVSKNAQLDNTDGKAKIVTKLHQRIGLVSRKTDTVQEARISHNMLVCQVANYSPICIDMTLSDCAGIDRQLLKAYHYKMQCMTNDAKHHIFISQQKGGIGVKSFIREYIGALLQDVEVQISNPNSLAAHALGASIEEAAKKGLWELLQAGCLPPSSAAATAASGTHISGRKMLSYNNDISEAVISPITYDHPHMMEKAIATSSSLGFMLRNLDNEFISRYTDELALFDRYAKAIGDPTITSRAKLNPTINEGNKHFAKYAMTGRVGLLIAVTVQEALRHTLHKPDENKAFQECICKQEFHKNLNLFPGEFSPIRLQLIAKETLRKFAQDYSTGSFINLMEWRSPRDIDQPTLRPKLNDSDYKTIIDLNNVYQPSFTKSMQYNSERMAQHLISILRLDPDKTDPWQHNQSTLCDQEIVDQAMQHDLPIFLSIDGGLDDNGMATVSISIVAPDIRAHDVALEWKDRTAKVLLVRSWRLPSQWGTSKVCINMAESIGFILGAYTIPNDIPVIFITDSNNARTLQRNVTCLHMYTHRKQVRHIKQSIESSIANHLEYLTLQWPKPENISEYHKRLYQRGKRVCKIWAETNAPREDPMETPDDSTATTSSSQDSTDDDTSMDPAELEKQKKQQARFSFNHSMYDFLPNFIIMKVFSHQLDPDFAPSTKGKDPKPNMFTVSANQIVDNAADQARRLFGQTSQNQNKLFYPPFSPQWNFSFQGSLTNKGATKVFHEQLDNELIYRQQHRSKQGVFFRLLPFIGLNAQQVGDESQLRSIVKMTAMCWTRKLYCDPIFAARVWESWFHNLTPEEQANDNIPATLPKDWRRDKWASDSVMRVCPACANHRKARTTERMGTLEHMHLYCESPHLVNARAHCYEKIESALEALYDFASYAEYDKSLMESTRQTRLQESLENTAKQTELEERPICRDSKVILESRTSNIAILSRHEIKTRVMLNSMQAEKISEYDSFPLAHRTGLIHSIGEDDLSIDDATIIDINFLGLFPKSLLGTLRSYKSQLKKTMQAEFAVLIDKLVSTVIHRPLKIQCIIKYILAAIKMQVETDCKQRQETPHHTAEITDTSQLLNTATSPADTHPSWKLCHANKCRILLAKGILRKPTTCARGRNMCSGCILEATRQRKTATVELEILEANTPNHILAPLLEYTKTPTSIKQLRHALGHLPTLNGIKRDDSIFGVVRYIANSLGFRLCNATAGTIDELMPTKLAKEKWRQATFSCKGHCHQEAQTVHGDRAFCQTCSYIVAHRHPPNLRICPGCLKQDSWGPIGYLCLACQFATIIFRNRFACRYTRYVEQWLPMLASDIDDDDTETPSTTATPRSTCLTPESNEEEVLRLRQLTLNLSFSEIRSRSSPEENQVVIENITMLQRDLKSQSSSKRDIESLQSEPGNQLEDTRDDNLSPRKKNSLKKKLFDDNASYSSTSLSRDHSSTYRPPLLPIDLNSDNVNTRWKHRNSKQQRSQEKMMKAKLVKLRNKSMQS